MEHFADPAAGEACFKQFVDDGQVRLGFCRGVYWLVYLSFMLSTFSCVINIIITSTRVLDVLLLCPRSAL